MEFQFNDPIDFVNYLAIYFLEKAGNLKPNQDQIIDMENYLKISLEVMLQEYIAQTQKQGLGA